MKKLCQEFRFRVISSLTLVQKELSFPLGFQMSLVFLYLILPPQESRVMY